MNIKFLLTGLLVAFLSSGCATKMNFHKSPVEFASDSSSHKTEKFIVNRPYQDVVDTYKRLTPKCLNKALQVEVARRGYSDNGIYYFKSSVKSTQDRTYLGVQMLRHDMFDKYIKQGLIPKDGVYVLVTEAKPISANQTQIKIMTRNWISAPSEFNDAIRSWSKGEFEGCPVIK